MKENFGKTEMVYKTLQEDIIEGRLSPGERLVERDLTERFGVSKTPLREAFVRLKQDGLIEGMLHQGVSVIRISRKDAVEIYDLREVLEGLVARKVAEGITSDRAEKLRSLIQLSKDCAQKDDVKEYARVDLEFHNLLRIFSENQRSSQVMQSLHHQSRILLKTSMNLPKRGPKISLREHKKILKAILNHDPIVAEQMAKEHVRNTREAVLDWFDRTQW
jgi:DNA-binding GntR family transcriptional regulator